MDSTGNAGDLCWLGEPDMLGCLDRGSNPLPKGEAKVVISKFDGWLKAEPDEPTFTLMARDWRSPNFVKQWAYERERDIATGRKPEADREMVVEARRIAKAMADWYAENRSGDPYHIPVRDTVSTGGS